MLSTTLCYVYPDSSVDKEFTCNAGDPGSIPGSGRSPGERKGYPLRYSGLENSMDSPWGHKESDMTEPLSLSNEDLQDLLELTSKKDVLFIIGD